MPPNFVLAETTSRSAGVLSASGLTKTFRQGGHDVPVLNGVDLVILPGSSVAVMGASGSGKSTLLYCLSGLETATSGQVRFNDVELGNLSRTSLAKLRRDMFGFVFQSYNLIPSLTAFDNVAAPLRLARRRFTRVDVLDALTAVSLSTKAKSRPGQLSGGECQRVAIARALAARPKVLFADEPTGALDTENGAEVLSLLHRTTRDTGGALIMVTHDAAVAASCHRVIFLRDGRVHLDLDGPNEQQVSEANLPVHTS